MPAAGATERLRCTALVAEAARRRQSASAVATSHGHGTALFGPGPDYPACVAFLKSHGLGRPASSHVKSSRRRLPDRGRGRLSCGLDGAIARVNEGEGGAELRRRLLPRFADVLCAAEAPAMIAVDIPIGLPAQAGRGGPAAEKHGAAASGRAAVLRLLRSFRDRDAAHCAQSRIEFGLRGIRYAREREREQGIFWRRTAKHFGT